MTLLTLACLSFSWLHGPLHGVTMRAIASSSARLGQRRLPAPATRVAPCPARDAAELNAGGDDDEPSPGEETDISEAVVRQRNAEMMPVTPGVSPEQYMDAADETTPTPEEEAAAPPEEG